MAILDRVGAAGTARAQLTRLLVLPMYPQYAGSSVGTALMPSCGAGSVAQSPELRTITFSRRPGYIGALVASVRALEREANPSGC
jgi:protoheme ferro-lyase